MTFDKIPTHTSASETKTPATVAEARACAKRAKQCYTRVSISQDESVEVAVSRAALLRALASLDGAAPCGGTYWLDDDSFCLSCTY